MSPSIRAAVLAEWRGLPDRKGKPDRWQSPDALLPKLLQQLGLRERLREAEVIDAWKAIVGEFISAHSAPVSLREGVLSCGCFSLRSTTNSKPSRKPST